MVRQTYSLVNRIVTILISQKFYAHMCNDLYCLKVEMLILSINNNGDIYS